MDKLQILHIFLNVYLIEKYTIRFINSYIQYDSSSCMHGIYKLLINNFPLIYYIGLCYVPNSNCAYIASKHGVVGFTKTFAQVYEFFQLLKKIILLYSTFSCLSLSLQFLHVSYHYEADLCCKMYLSN